MDEFRKLKTQYQTVYFKGHKIKYKGRKQSQHHQPSPGQSYPQNQLNMQSSEDFPALKHRRQLSPKNNQKNQQNANLNKNTRSSDSDNNRNGNRTHTPHTQHRPPVYNSSKQQQQTNAEQVDPVRQQVNRPEQMSAVINEQASGINHTSTPATSHQLTGEANSVEREMVSGESCSGPQPVESPSTVDSGVEKSDNYFSVRASPSRRCEDGSNESVDVSEKELVDQPRRSARISIKTHEYEEVEL